MSISRSAGGSIVSSGRERSQSPVKADVGGGSGGEVVGSNGVRGLVAGECVHGCADRGGEGIERVSTLQERSPTGAPCPLSQPPDVSRHLSE
jgi:hypothetical protein